MNRRIVFRPQAEREVVDAWHWYRERRAETGQAFVDEFNRCIDRISATPETFPKMEGESRRVLLRRVPYGLFYRVTDEEIVVLACFHMRRAPAAWRGRK